MQISDTKFQIPNKAQTSNVQMFACLSFVIYLVSGIWSLNFTPTGVLCVQS